MQEPQDPITQQPEFTRSKILDSYLTPIEDSFRENCPQLKLINYGTGSGKTHQLFQAIFKTIKDHPDTQVIGIYIAPLREHLSVPASVKAEYPDIPVYTISSLEMKRSDELTRLYKDWINSLLKNKSFWRINSKIYPPEKVEQAQQDLRKVINVIERLRYIKSIELGDEKLEKIQIKKAEQELNKLIEDFLLFTIRCKVQENWPEECLKLMEIFFPLHLLREKSGILMLTYDKFETAIPYFIKNDKTWIKKSNHLDEYIIQPINRLKKFVFAFDEQEDGYQIMLNEKIDIISPQELAINNALSSINREFSIIFSKQNRKYKHCLDFIENNKGAIEEFKEHLEKDKILSEELEELASIYQQMTYEEGNSTNFINQILRIRKGFQQSIEEIITVLSSCSDKNRDVLSFEILSKVFSKFENNRSLLIPQKLYTKISNDLMNIFSYNNLYIYNIEPLKKLFLTRASGGHVHITEEKPSNKTSVAELIYTILAVRSQIKNIKTFLSGVLDAEDSQSRSLDIWSKQIDKVKNASVENAAQNQDQDRLPKYINRSYVYESDKSIINIKEISRYQSPQNSLVDPGLREVSIGSTVILTSPELRISSLLRNNNVVFLISATGGIFGDLSKSYDMRYLEDKLRNEEGQTTFRTMVEKEVLLCEKIRDSRQTKRTLSVSFFSKDLSTFPNDQTQKAVERFEDCILRDFIESFKSKVSWFGSYKIQEINSFIRFLFYLLEDESIQETIAFTQTLNWIKKLIQFWKSLKHDHFVIEESKEHPNIYFVKIDHPKYKSNIRIKVILYEASFNKNYYDKKNQKTYLDELVEEKGQKIFFVSAYQSAAKGLNPIIKTENGEEKDFDSLVLLMDSYYTIMKPPSKKIKTSSSEDSLDKSTTIYHFALMKSIVNLGDSSLEIKDFNKYLNQPEAIEFREQQHQILLGKEILQAIGRSERRDFQNQVIKIFINEETQKNLVNFYRYLERKEPNEIRKLSVNNYKVYLSVQDEEKKRSIKDYDDHIYTEIKACIDFQDFRKRMLDEIKNLHESRETFNIIKAWDAMRDPIVFKDPNAYLAKLRSLKLFPEDFIESLFYQKPENLKFTPYLTWEKEGGKKFRIISDSLNGEKLYAYQNRLYPEYLKTNASGYDWEGNEIGTPNFSSDSICSLYHQLIPQPEVFNNYVPRPDFFYDVLYPSLTENFVECWIQKIIFQNKDWKTIKTNYGFEQLQDFKKYNKLYEQFDLYYLKGETLFCIDVKAWSVASGNKLSKPTLDKAQNKLSSIAANYPEFKVVKGLILNLHSKQEKSHEYSSTLSSGNLIYFDNQNTACESSILRSFLFSKEK